MARSPLPTASELKRKPPNWLAVASELKNKPLNWLAFASCASHERANFPKMPTSGLSHNLMVFKTARVTLNALMVVKTVLIGPATTTQIPVS